MPTRTRHASSLCQCVTLLVLSGCSYFLPTGESTPDYCYRVGPNVWACVGDAQYPRDTIPDSEKDEHEPPVVWESTRQVFVPPCVTDSECEGLVPTPYRAELDQ